MTTLEQLIEAAAEELPEHWRITVEVERGCGEVIVNTPTGSEVFMDDGDSDLREQFLAARQFISDEIQAAALPAPRSPLPAS